MKIKIQAQKGKELYETVDMILWNPVSYLPFYANYLFLCLSFNVYYLNFLFKIQYIGGKDILSNMVCSRCLFRNMLVSTVNDVCIGHSKMVQK